MLAAATVPDSAVPPSETLLTLSTAVRQQRRVRIRYRSRAEEETLREVDPYGVVFLSGRWFMTGYCHLRQGLRTFHVHRIRELKVNTAKPRTPDFEVPADFSLDSHVAYYPWQHRFHEPMEVTLLLRGEPAQRVSSLFPGAAVEPADNGARAKLDA